VVRSTLRPNPSVGAAGRSVSTIGRDRAVTLVVLRGGSAQTIRVLSLPSRRHLALVDAPADDGEANDSLISDIAYLSTDRPSGYLHSARSVFHGELTSAEARVLEYLPTNLAAPEIADELYVSVNTVKTHMRHIYAKLDAHRRHQAVDRARALGLLSPSSDRRRALA
jgi:ATP/maltotriose-dependent transcriptional regulator MalT